MMRGVLGLTAVCLILLGATSYQVRKDPAAWGADHVGQPLPDFMAGDECLFCHRNDIGATWGKNAHGRAIREIQGDEAALAILRKSTNDARRIDETTFVLGGKRDHRFLRSGQKFGHLDLLHSGQWNETRFNDACAGCHCTAVDSATRAFTARSLDCFVCHGANTVDHTKDSSLVHLSKKRNDPAPVVISICAQCHARGGKSKSTGRPFPHHFVAGDNLFRDYVVDLTAERLQRENPTERHILENIRDVVVDGKNETTCVSCHDVHRGSSKKHQAVPKSSLCGICHEPNRPKKEVKPYDRHHPTCGY
jgi:predicted CXXCH cytochrome family protein